MRCKPVEVPAIVRHGVRAFALTGGNMKADELAASFVTAMLRMKRLLVNTPHPFVAAVTRSGDVRIVYPANPS